MKAEENVLTVAEVAKLHKDSTTSVYRWIENAQPSIGWHEKTHCYL